MESEIQSVSNHMRTRPFSGFFVGVASAPLSSLWFFFSTVLSPLSVQESHNHIYTHVLPELCCLISYGNTTMKLMKLPQISLSCLPLTHTLLSPFLLILVFNFMGGLLSQNSGVLPSTYRSLTLSVFVLDVCDPSPQAPLSSATLLGFSDGCLSQCWLTSSRL